VCTIAQETFTTEDCTGAPLLDTAKQFQQAGIEIPTFFNQGPVKNFQSGSAQIFFIRVWLKKSNQGLIDLEIIFRHGHDRDGKNFSKV